MSDEKYFALEFRHLSFAYPVFRRRANGNGEGTAAGLHDVSFHIAPGETVAIAGPTGSGKSTVAQLLWRRYPVPDDSMFLGGADANHSRVTEWRARFALVSQESFLFSDTVRANINLAGRLSGTDDLQRVGQRAALDKDVSDFPKGYDTIVGERGITLSGGQKQRVTLARALASEADVLVLDDAFSAVDAQTEREIMDELEAHFGQRIIILITHRLAALQRVDRILFFEHGRLVDSGSHEQLLAHDSAYAKWVAREALIEELEEL